MSPAFKELENWVRTGRIAEARSYLHSRRRELRKDAGAHLDILAAYYRRVGLPQESLRLLVARVRPSGRHKTLARVNERIEYAAALTSCGAASEALALLNAIEPSETPDVHLHRAFALFKEWNYANAIPELEAYVKSAKIDPYFRRVGELNLAASLVYERRSEAQSFVNALIENATHEGSLRILANARELATQAALHRGDWYEAERSIEEARRLLRDEGAGDALYIEKWHAILHVRRQNGSESRAMLTAVQTKARTRGDWESVRDIDRELALATGSEEKLHHVYFGTPYPAYRARLAADLRERGLAIDFGHTHRWQLGSGRSESALDLRSVAGVSRKDKVTVRLLRALADDFYAPPTLAALHTRVHPGRHFNILSSPGLMLQSLTRARRWLSETAPGLDIRIVGTGRYALHALRRAPDILVGAKVEEVFPRDAFSIRDYVRFSRLRRRSAQRSLFEAVAQGLLRTEGSGKNVKYRRARP